MIIIPSNNFPIIIIPNTILASDNINKSVDTAIPIPIYTVFNHDSFKKDNTHHKYNQYNLTKIYIRQSYRKDNA